MRKFLKNHIFSLIAWIVILFISIIMLPNIGNLTRVHSNISLPKNVESEVANTLQNKWGPTKKNTYQIALVFHKKHGKLTPANEDAINATVARLQNHHKKYGIKSVLAPDANQATRKQLQSKDGTTWIMQVNVAKNHAPINDVNQQLERAEKTSGVQTYVTGADVLQNAFTNSIQNGIKKTELITVVFIFIVLIIVFRSPIVPLISLVTVGLAFITSFAIVTNLVERMNFPFSNFTQVFMVIVLFGIGTDYNILLYDKFKEDLGKGMDKYQAQHDALKSAGKTILYSGSSILIGFTALILARFSIYQSAVGVAVGVAVLLLVLLTLNPFFMDVLGGNMFWPAKKFSGEMQDKLWHGISAATLAHPLLYLFVLAVIVLPFCLMYSSHLNYDDTAEIANNVPAKAGLLVVQKHFSKGTAEPSSLYIRARHSLDNEADLKLIDQVTKQLQASKDVALVTSVTQPAGSPIKQFYVNNQLGTVNQGVGQVRSGLGKLSKGSKHATKGAAKLTNGANRLQTGSNELQSGASQLQNGTSRLQNGASRLQNGANRLQAGAGQLETGTNSLIAGIGRLQTGTGSLQSGTASLATGTQQLVNELSEMSAQLNNQMGGSSISQLGALESALPQINNGVQALNNALSGTVATGTLTTNLTSAQRNASRLENSLGRLSSLAGNSNGAQGSNLASSFQSNLAASLRRNGTNLSAAQQRAVQEALQATMSKANNSTSNSGMSSALNEAISAAQGLQGSMQGLQQNNLTSEIQTLRSQVRVLAAASERALPSASQALGQLSAGLNRVQGAVSQGSIGAHRLQNGASQVNSGARQLYNGLGVLSTGAGRLNSGAGQLSSGLGSLSTGASQLSNGLEQGSNGTAQLTNGLGRLSDGAGSLSNGASRLESSLPKITNGLDEANSGLGQGEAYLNGLQSSAAANTFYIPKAYLNSTAFKQSTNVYLSPNKKETFLTVIFKSNPSAPEATKKSQQLSAMVRKDFAGTHLKHATVAMGGESSKIEDTKNVASGDFVRTAAIMVIGITLALIFVTRSLLQPVYIMATLLVSYLCSLSINQWIVKAILNRNLLTWNTPFFSFIMLIALGVDYSIFLMTRYRELDKSVLQKPSARILRACGLLGMVVVSAAIILSGTFAALIPSGIPTLIEVALTVIIGIIILIFILPLTMSASVKLTYEGVNFHWGKHHKAGKKELRQRSQSLRRSRRARRLKQKNDKEQK